MAFERTLSFTCELPLRVSPAEDHVLNTRLEAARQVYNTCLGEALRRAQLLKERRAYRKARMLPPGEERTRAFRAARQAVAFTDAAVQRYGVRLRQQAFKDRLDVHVVQKLASRAFAAVDAYLVGKRGKPRFKSYRQLDTVEGKSNQAGLHWRCDNVEWKDLVLPALVDPHDPVLAHGLSCRVKLLRREAAHRKTLHGQLVNCVLAMGRVIKTEKLSYRAMQRQRQVRGSAGAGKVPSDPPPQG